MDPKTVETISLQVYKRFPEVNGKKPRVAAQKANGANQKPASRLPVYLLTYRGKGTGPGGEVIPRYVRVVANQKGRILKITTSR
jgi:hypothetical protein